MTTPKLGNSKYSFLRRNKRKTKQVRVVSKQKRKRGSNSIQQHDTEPTQTQELNRKQTNRSKAIKQLDKQQK